MTQNFLNSEEVGPTPNYSSFHETNLIEDTVNWVEMSYQFIADSAYQYLAIGNLFDDSLTDTLRIGGEPTGSVTSYYYFDDFCLTTSPEGCDFTSSVKDKNSASILLYPNPCQKEVFIEYSIPFDEILIYTLQGELLNRYSGNGTNKMRIDLFLQAGIYYATIESKEGRITKRFMVSN